MALLTSPEIICFSIRDFLLGGCLCVHGMLMLVAYLEFGSGGGVWLMGGSPGGIGAVHVTYVKRQKSWRKVVT